MKSDPTLDLTVLCLDPLARPEHLPPSRVAVRVERRPFAPAHAPSGDLERADAGPRALRAMFERTGGIVPEDEAARLPATDADGPGLRTLVDERRVVAVVDRGRRLVPLFQFDAARARPCAGVRAALAELVDVLDADETASWFARPNPWLGGLAPAEAVRGAPGAVLQAARAERFIRRW
jgi:hypothetical protein